jgi:hypothetical protein
LRTVKELCWRGKNSSLLKMCFCILRIDFFLQGMKDNAAIVGVLENTFIYVGSLLQSKLTSCVESVTFKLLRNS